MSEPGSSDSSWNPYQSPANAVDDLAHRLDLTSASPIVSVLRETRPWVRLFSVLGFIGSALILAGAALALVLLLLSQGALQAAVSLVYVAMGILFIVPSIHLYRYADRIRFLEISGTPDALASALEAQKSFWRFAGIFTTVILVIYALLIGIGAVVGIVAVLSG
jgi:hypothetical protein